MDRNIEAVNLDTGLVVLDNDESYLIEGWINESGGCDRDEATHFLFGSDEDGWSVALISDFKSVTVH